MKIIRSKLVAQFGDFFIIFLLLLRASFGILRQILFRHGGDEPIRFAGAFLTF